MQTLAVQALRPRADVRAAAGQDQASGGAAQAVGRAAGWPTRSVPLVRSPPPPSLLDGLRLPGLGSRPTLLDNKPPQELGRAGDRLVVLGTDAGDYYCEHHFFVAQLAAQKSGSSVLRNRHGEPLVGFIHVPADQHTYGWLNNYTQDERHAELRQVIGAAIAGVAEEALPQVRGESMRILLTGYGKFQGVVSNPTGEFMQHAENLDAAMRNAFGDALLTPSGRAAGEVPDGLLLDYQVRAADGSERTIEVRSESLPVDDRVLRNEAPHSLAETVVSYRPHAVIGTGVAGSGAYLIEWHADNGGMAEDSGGFTHNDSKRADKNLPDNYAIARAIYAHLRVPVGPNT